MLVFDTESDGLLWDATRFWVAGWTTDGREIHVTQDIYELTYALEIEQEAACHNAFLHDFPLIERLTGYQYKGLKVDTLWLSWYLDPRRPKHSLESYEDELGVKKVYVDPDDWKNIDIDLAIKRVTEDVKLNWLLWKKQEKLLERIYSE